MSDNTSELSATRTPTIREWYGADYTPTFPDDDGEEMRRVSSRFPVSQAEYDSLVADRDEMLASLKNADTALIENGLTSENLIVQQVRAALAKAEARARIGEPSP